jgi:hypothetical protein
MLDYFEGRLKRGELKPTSLARQRGIVRDFAVSFGGRPKSQFGPKAVDRYMESIGHLSPGTRRGRVGIVRAFAKYLHVAHGYPDVTDAFPRVRVPRTVPRSIPHQDVARLFAGLPDRRARAIVALMAYQGLRAGEVVEPAGRGLRRRADLGDRQRWPPACSPGRGRLPAMPRGVASGGARHLPARSSRAAHRGWACARAASRISSASGCGTRASNIAAVTAAARTPCGTQRRREPPGTACRCGASRSCWATPARRRRRSTPGGRDARAAPGSGRGLPSHPD